MKKFTYLILFLVLPLFLNAQKTKIQWGPANKSKIENGKNFLERRMIGSIGDNHYLHAGVRKNQYLLKFNSNNKLTESSPINFKYEDKKIDLVTLINTSSGNFLLSKRHYNKLKENKFFINEVTNEGVVSQNVKLLFSHHYIGFKNMQNQQTSDDDNDITGIWTSSDSSKVLFVSTESSYQFNKRRGDDTFHFALFDSDMKLIWQKTLGFPYTDNNIKVNGFKITDNGRIYAHGQVASEDKKEKRMNRTNIFLFEIKENGIVEIDQLKINNKYLESGSLLVNKDESIYYFGVFKEKKEKSGKWKGIYLFKFDSSGKESFNKTYNWEDQVDQVMDSRNFFLKFRGGLVDYDNQAITLAIEKHTFKSNDGKKYLKGTNQIIVPSFSFDGDLRWMTLIEKEFKAGETPEASSFLFAHKDENIYLIFNDDKNKEERKALGATRNPFKSSYFMDITKVNLKGEIELRETLINSKEFKFFFDVEESFSIGNGKVLIFGEGNVSSDFRLGMLELD